MYTSILFIKMYMYHCCVVYISTITTVHTDYNTGPDCGVDIVFGSSIMNRAAFHIAKPLDMNVNSNTSDDTPLIVASRDGN